MFVNSTRLILTFVFALATAACGPTASTETPHRSETSSSSPSTPPAADRLGCYGGDPRVSPTLDEIAAGGVLFERAYTSMPMTLPAHSTLMTESFRRFIGCG